MTDTYPIGTAQYPDCGGKYTNLHVIESHLTKYTHE